MGVQTRGFNVAAWSQDALHLSLGDFPSGILYLADEDHGPSLLRESCRPFMDTLVWYSSHYTIVRRACRTLTLLHRHCESEKVHDFLDGRFRGPLGAALIIHLIEHADHEKYGYFGAEFGCIGVIKR